MCNAFYFNCVINTITTTTTTCNQSNLFVTFHLQAVNETGCDTILDLGVWFKRQASQNDSWFYKKAETVSQTHLTIDILSYELYDVYVIVVNNKNISSTSDNFTVDLTTRE